MATYYLVGSGIASLACAAYLIHDANVAGGDIVIFEESQEFGGALDARGDAASGYFMSGSRMFEHKYTCTFDLLSFIPSGSDPTISVTEETNRAEAQSPWHNRARLVDRDGRITDFHKLGFNDRDRLDLFAIFATSEKALAGKRIADCFSEHFFETNFWFEWCTLFAFQRWHSAIELRRYLLRFIHHFSTIDTQAGVYRTNYNQYDSIVVPLVTWLKNRGVEIRLGTTVEDLDFAAAGPHITVESIRCTQGDSPLTIPVTSSDFVFVTNGSMTANKTFGSLTVAPAIDRSRRSGAWRLWERIARGRPQFGNPSTFDAHIDESLWESFTVTVDDPLFFRLVQNFTGNEAGKGGLLTFTESNWLLTLSIFHQPFFANQPSDAFVWWGYGLFHDKRGNYVDKTMPECTGREILEEVLGHLHVGEHRDAILAASNVIPCMMPYITSQFLVRGPGDRPKVVPDGSTNLAFVGQYAEQPDDVVFTVEYSIRAAQTAVYTLLKLDKKPPPVYKGAHDPRVLLESMLTVYR
jgi:oleate hydratase